MTDYIQVVTTTDSETDARRIASALVERRLAACVQVVGPVQSVYHWKGQVESAAEWQCHVKTRGDRFDQLQRTIVELHSYEVPEILALPIVAGSSAYLKWIDEELARE